ncbi:MAG: PilZ domain-containing protein [Desulfobacterales bacterium]
MNAVPEQKRTDVRGDFSFSVSYRFLTPEEYRTKKNAIEQVVNRGGKRLTLDSNGTDDRGRDSDSRLVDFLMQMDEKMNRILDLLTEKETRDEGLLQGVGINISGSGMKLRVDRPAEAGQVIHTDFVLSRFPYVRLSLYGRIVQTTPVQESDTGAYDLGVKFLDMDDSARDQIVARIFQAQREAIRRNRND